MNIPLFARLRSRAQIFRGATVIGAGQKNLSWIYSFWKEIRDYVYVREEDNVVILPPNRVYKTNDTGIKIIKFLDEGGRFETQREFDADKLRDITAFFSDIKAVCEGSAITALTRAFDFDFSRLPILGEIAVTYRCNNTCLFCYAGCGRESCCAADRAILQQFRAHTTQEMSTADIKKIIDIFKEKAKIPFFSFTGGEPLLRADLEECIAYAAKIKLRVNLISNATCATKKRAESLYAAGLRTAQVSLESPDPAIHDLLCGVHGAWQKTVDGIKNLQQAGISVQTNSTLTRMNRESLRLLPDFLKTLQVPRFSMNLFIPSRDNGHTETLFVPYSQTGEFIDDIRVRARKIGLEFFWYSPVPLCMYNTMTHGLGNKNCAAADGLISVDPQGNIHPCSSHPEILGNLLTQSFDEVWFSSRAQHFKKKEYAPEKCRACTAFIACQAACPLYWDYAGYEELTRAPEAS